MKVEIKIPAMGESVSEAVINHILKPSGSYVHQDEEILELETDKVNQVLYAPKSGELYLSIQPQETVKIGQVIGSIDTEAKAPTEAQPTPSQPKEGMQPASSPPPSPSQPVKAPSSLSPSSSAASARVTVSDFVHSLQEPSSPTSALETKKGGEMPSLSNRKKMSPLRKVIAKRLVEVKNQTAMLTTFNEVDMTSIIEIRNREKDAFLAKHGVKLGFMSFFIKAVVSALKTVPEINAFIENDEIITLNTFDISVAVSTDKGLMVPVVRNCEEKSFADIEKDLGIYAKKAREGTISIDDLRGGSFTITNGGVFGSLLSTPILNPPQSGILGMHSITKRAVVINETITIRPMMYLALSYDHRLIDGKEAVTFLVCIKEILEDPSRLLLNL